MILRPLTLMVVWMTVSLPSEALAQSPVAPPPSPLPTPILSNSERAELERLRQEKQMQDLIDQTLSDKGEIRDLVQDEVDRAFSANINLLNFLLTVLTLLPILIAIALFFMRRSVIDQVVAETKRQLQDEVEKQLADEVRRSVVDQIVAETIRRIQTVLDQQSEAMLEELRQKTEALQQEFVAELSTLQTLVLAAQAEKDQIFQAIAQLTPSPAQEDSVPSDIQKKIQDLTEQLEVLTAKIPLLLTVDDYFKQGEAFYFEGRYEDALVSYSKALELKPDDPTIWINQAISLRRLDRFEEAIASHDRAIALSPDLPRVWYTKGYTLRRCQQFEEAVACFDQSLRLDPVAYRSWDNRGSALAELERYDEAIASYDRALEIEPTYSKTWNHKAHCYASWGKTDLALDALKQAITLNPDYRALAQTCPEFVPIRTDPRFQALVYG